jgi:hypothetical protein
VSIFRIDRVTDERLRWLATAAEAEGGWVDLPEPIIVRVGRRKVTDDLDGLV